MNRRKALRNIILGTGGAIAAASGYKWYSISKTPDLNDLVHFKELLAELAETLIPATDIPGAKDAGVGAYIYKMVMECADKRSQNKFLSGLHDLEDYAHATYAHSFIQCTLPQREAVMNHFEQKGKPHDGIIGKIQRRFLGNSFYSTLKFYAVSGYCTSQAGATQLLAYDYIPGGYIACMTINSSQKSWATK